MLNKSDHLEFNRLFLDFLDYLLQLGYGEERTGFIEGVIQRAFFDDWVKFLAFRKQLDGPFTKIKTELLDDD